jgi:uncharacterized protein with NRDE domain
MCTVLIGRDVTGRGEIVIGANRDENPARPSDPPGVLLDSPRLVGGRDRVSGGTWLAVRTPHSAGAEGEVGPSSVTLLLNRRPLPGAPVPARSRGLLTIDVARARDPLATAQEEAASGRYGPCTLVHVSPAACWWLAIPSASPARAGTIAHGWHAITHAEMDDSSEPRTVWLGRELARDTLMGTGLALAKFASLLAHHGDASSPAVCLHEGVMRTVSSALIVLRSGQPGQLHDIYRHVEGRPCTQPFVDVSHLLGTPARNDEAP